MLIIFTGNSSFGQIPLPGFKDNQGHFGGVKPGVINFETDTTHPEYGLLLPRDSRLQESRELIHLRTSHTRVFLNNDGTYTSAVSSVPLHFKDDSGQWISIGYTGQEVQLKDLEQSETEDFTWVGSCFFPEFSSAELVIPVTEGNTILNTYLEWDFVSTNQAWMSEQRSYVIGPSGQTQVFSGSGNTEGTQSYSTNTGIAGGVSDGEVTLTFHAARTWGGSGCNTTWSYIARRYVEITHGEIEFGDGEVVINEYSASNRQWTDDFGNYEDWVELYNPSGSFVDLTGYYLSDNPNNPMKWQFPGGILPPGGHLLVICSGRDAMAGSVPHANFRLSQLKPESILLSDPEGNLLEEYPLFTTQNGHSYGRITSGAEQWGIFPSPTPGSFNLTHRNGYTPMVVFSEPAGFYSGHITVELSVPDQTPHIEIRYTTNGTTPTTNSTLYTEPVAVNQTTAIRARAFSSDPMLLPGFIETQTYFVNEGHNLPVFSFSGDQLFTLFNGSQIETIGAYEFFDENGTFIDKSVGDFDKHGNDSWGYPQRGVDFVSRDEYGYNAELTHPFFPTSHRTGFQRLMVKAAANDNYPFETGGAHIRDSYIQSLSQLIGLDLDVRSSRNVILYVNGQYWGIYDLREKVDDNEYTDFYYDQPRKYKGSTHYIQFLKTWGGTEAKYGEHQAIQDWANLRQFISTNNMGDSANYAYVDSQLNFRSFIDHFVYNSFVVSRDWLNYNTGWWRGLHPDGDAQQWRYILWDTEAALGHYTNFTGLPNVTATAPPCQVENLNVGNGHAQSLKKLINENQQFREMYVNRYTDLLNTGLSCDYAIHVLDSMIQVIAPEMPRQIQRWGGNIATWEQNVQDVRDFLTERCEFMIQGLMDCYDLEGPYDVTFNVVPEHTGKIKMNSEWLPRYLFEAFMYGNIGSRFEAQGFGPYVFSHWEIDGHVVEPGTDNPVITFELLQNENITAHFYNPNLEEGIDLLYYWHFNNLETPDGDITEIQADYSLLPDVEPLMVYEGFGVRDMDAFNEGSSLNLHLIEESGKAARVRNPSNNRSLLFNLPTTGYQSLIFEYAAHRSANGMLSHIISYSVDGQNFTSDGLPESVFEVSEEYQLITIDFSELPEVNNNPDFMIRITFDGNHAQPDGNNRFDNITLKGETWIPVYSSLLPEPVKISAYPNPFGEQIYLVADEPIVSVSIFDLPGKKIMEESFGGSYEITLGTSWLTPGMYLLQVQTARGSVQLKMIRE